MDSYQPSGSEEFTARLKDGKTFLGRRAKIMGVWGNIAWTDLTVAPVTGYPQGVCSVTVSAQGNDLYVKAATLRGALYQTHCDINGAAVLCDEPWIATAS
ncbi:hypothetical protein ACFVX6_16000 [Streptomyces sp. NPDC058289]|uniref:hypothetical protein n=1 Tax=Streptomyces sp. NPDC058289 TaxID=3346425 RepID=UPI0036E611F7